MKRSPRLRSVTLTLERDDCHATGKALRIVDNKGAFGDDGPYALLHEILEESVRTG